MSSSQTIGVMITTMAAGLLYMLAVWRIYRKKVNEGFLTWQAEATGFLLLGTQCLYIAYLMHRYPQYSAFLAVDVVLGMLFILPTLMMIIVGTIWRLRMKMGGDL